MHDIIVLGAGAVGVNAALIASAFGYSVVLVEPAADIFQGAPAVSFVNHGDGFEYYKKHHRRTGYLCIDGAIIKSLLYGADRFHTHVDGRSNPVRFLLSRRCSIKPEDWSDNVERMRDHFRRRARSLARRHGWDEDEIQRRLGRTGDNFRRQLEPKELEAFPETHAGFDGSSFGVNMPYYYSLVTRALERSRVLRRYGSEITAIEKTGSGYLVETNRGPVRGRCLLLCAGHKNPLLASRFQAGSKARETHAPSGMFFLNFITFVRLPRASQEAQLEAARRTSFTLQQEHGAMFASLVPPTPAADGWGVLYFPSESGSQLRKHSCKVNFTPPPSEWDDLMREDGLKLDDQNVLNTQRQAEKIYPFLKGYAQLTRVSCRPVFNSAYPGNQGGEDRPVRAVPEKPCCLASDGSASVWSAPKWTNCELVALQAADHAARYLGGAPLPRLDPREPADLKDIAGKFDLVAISKRVGLREIGVDRELALRYAKEAGLPREMVASNATEPPPGAGSSPCSF